MDEGNQPTKQTNKPKNQKTKNHTTGKERKERDWMEEEIPK